ncbi:HAD family hydrolase [Xanthobacter oligotrophicus]|uniref:HAD family hydrolase n=1 Tax=Xanthobacter oligotrophicus TaxID=2607286 RepID=UPI0011F3E0A9|nr:HAD family hydrolase [Xanthobacter oligotrophicus]MCG5237361.1 HAD family hydrolase [Xanthobacter oligotrophicus]
MAPLRAVLFDLDGTLVQARDSTWRLFERTNRAFDLGIDTPEAYFDLFRDNMFEALPRIYGEVRAEAVIAHFLELMRQEYAPPLVPGMVDVVRALSSECVLGIVSSNAVSAIRRIVVDAGIGNCIAHIFGGDVIPDKRVAIRQFLEEPSYATLRRCSNAYEEVPPVPFAPGEVALVTDTVGDVRQARDCGIHTIGVTWGLHEPGRLEDAGADFVAQWPMEIVSWVRRPMAKLVPQGG